MVTHTAETCLGVLKQSAKNFLKSAKSGNPPALKLFEQYFENPSKIRLALKLSQAQLVIARECGFASWPKLKSGLEQWQAQNEIPPSVLYNNLIKKITNLIATDDTGAKSNPENQDDAITFFCTFCSKSHHDVKKLIAGPAAQVFICNECVDLCNQIITEEQAEA